MSTRVALVTGGGTGIGAAIARRLSSDGYAVAVAGRRGAPLDEVAEQVGGLAIRADVSVEEGATHAVRATVERFGGLDALVLNAGIGGSGSLRDADPAVFAEVVSTNLTGAFLVARAAIGALLERRGSITTVASVAGLRASPSSLAYCASKAGLVMLTQCIALDHGSDGVRANCVCPGWVHTPMADREMDALGEELGVDRDGAYAAATAHVPLGRAASPEEVAAAVAWLASTGASYVNGATVTVDGGHTTVDVGTLAFGRPAT